MVQKLHSAITTFEFKGPKHRMVVTVGRFTNPAVEYARQLYRNDDPDLTELFDGEDYDQYLQSRLARSLLPENMHSKLRR